MTKWQTMWMVRGTYGLYSGAHFTRKDAMRDHSERTGQPWKELAKNGDRVIKVVVLFGEGIK